MGVLTQAKNGDGPIKLAHYCKRKKKVGLVRHPQLINMKQNKYPSLMVMEILSLKLAAIIFCLD
jgi:hypothetical protein